MATVIAIAVGASTTPLDLALAAPARSCDEPAITDGSGDADGGIDIARVTLTSDCRSYRFVLTTHQPFTDQQLGRWAVTLGPMDGTTRGLCGGMSILIAVEGSTSGLDADVMPLAGCNVYESTTADATRVSDRSIAVTVRAAQLRDAVSVSNGYRWQTFARSVSSDRFDVAPNYATMAWPDAVQPGIRLSSSTDGTSIAATWGAAAWTTGFEVRHREVGRRWSPPRRMGAQARHLSITGVRVGATYEVSVVALTSGQRSEPSVKRIRHTGPVGPPRNLRIHIVPGSDYVSFDAPADRGGRRNIRYHAQMVMDSGGYNDEASVSEDTRRVRLPSYLSEPATLYIRAVGDSPDGLWTGEWAAIRIDATPPE